VRTVEVFFDFSAAACFVAHARAARWPALGVEARWVPWETQPTLGPQGRARCPEEQALPPELDRAFAAEGLPFKPSASVPNTRVALRAALWVAREGDDGQSADFRDGVFRRLYGRGLDSHCWNADILAGLVERAGMDPIVFLDDMKAGFGAGELAACTARAGSLGLTEAPAMLDAGEVVQGAAAIEAALHP
jgi:predicted DsbA family dithiol-disulfide isomerase